MRHLFPLTPVSRDLPPPDRLPFGFLIYIYIVLNL